MVKAGKLVSTVAEVYRLPEGKIALTSRMLRERGLLTTGANGVNAPDMTFLDAARLMLGYLFLDKPSLMPDAVRVFGSLWGEYMDDRDRETFEGFPRRFSLVDVYEPIDLPADVHIPNVDFLYNLAPEKNTFENAFALVLEELSKPENRPFYRRLGIKIGADAHAGLCWIFLPGWTRAWQFSAKQTQINEAFAGLFPAGLDQQIDTQRHDPRRQFSVDNLVYELLSSYPAIHVERTINFDILAEVASVFEPNAAPKAGGGLGAKVILSDKESQIGAALEKVLAKWGDRPVGEMTRADFDRLLGQVHVDDGARDGE